MTATNGNAWLDAVLSDPANRVDFICYHPYGNLYQITKNQSGGVLNADDLNVGVNALRQTQIDRRQNIIDRLVANNRPSTTGLVTSEWNPSSWEGSYYLNCNRCMAHALGIVDTIFTYAEYGFLGAQYWDFPNDPSRTPIEAPGQKVFKTLQAHEPDLFLSSFVEPDFRLYSALDTQNNRLIIWAINYSNYNDRRVRFSLADGGSGVSVIRHRLASVSGDTNLATMNHPDDPAENVVWSVTDITDVMNPAEFTETFPPATLTMLRLERPLKSLPDGARVSLFGKSVTAVHPADGYLYVEQTDRSSGIRVVGDCSGISLGDQVTATGTIGTLKPDGSTPSERYVLAETLTRLSSSDALPPVWMTCRDVGGGPANGTAGVKDGFGLNNIGLLVSIVGRVTHVVDGELMYVDDGSNVADTDGEIGVLVKCPDTASFRQGDFLIVTGVVEGSVPEGWNVNRRLIRARTNEDLVHVPS
jgi:hypothetical protein